MGRRPGYVIFSVDVGVADVTKNSRLFAVTSTTCSTFLKELVVSLLCFLHPSTSSKHYTQSVSVPIGHPSGKERSE